MACESRYKYNAYNPSTGASGLAQFIPSTWAAMSPGTPRGVKYVTRYRQKAPIMRHRRYSNGKWTHHLIRNRRQIVTVVRVGRIRGSSPFHGWLNIRVAQRGWNQTSWDCGV